MIRRALLTVLLSGVALADEPPAPSTLPPALAGVDIIEHLGARLPDVDLVDETGKLVRLSEYFRGERPTLLYIGYFGCPMLCSLVMNGLVASLNDVELVPGRDYQLLTVSIDPGETPRDAAERQRGYLQSMKGNPPPAAWHFLTGRDPQVRALADAVGFKYNRDESTKSYAHSAAVYLVSPTGNITRYLYGVRFSPRDLRLAIVEASDGKVGTSMDRVLLQCYRYDPASRRYGWFVFGLMRIGGGLVALILALVLARYWRNEMRRSALDDVKGVDS